ncbi:hypothetical protein [Spectribacter hydrogenoxidans]|uniref:Sulfotransferase family protein n=1 Tax=Spectribacter hydrogenoxidans TaxID=3075608 RepID=A0ABU3C271_9GAMM|nr:hypothetical protein [Salinisphaera sp. W335]MDT0635615.1 hypothetical protein [Salinisphaera sp. W335]
MKRPDFFIPGAPKCGTTGLAQWLAAHPAVFFSPRKEPHFFNRDQMPATATLREYEQLFAGADDRHAAVGEASTHYLYSREAVPGILAYAPDARFIVCLRNPLEMAPALHGECLRQGWENVRRFDAAWHLQGARRAGRRIPRAARGDPERLLYGPYCRLGEQLQRLYGQVRADRVLPVLLDDIRDDAGRMYRRVLDFLGLQDDGRRDFPAVNPAARTRSVLLAQAIRSVSRIRDAAGVRGDWGIAARLRQLNASNAARAPLTSALREELCAYFADDVVALGELIERDLSDWLRGD